MLLSFTKIMCSNFELRWRNKPSCTLFTPMHCCGKMILSIELNPPPKKKIKGLLWTSCLPWPSWLPLPSVFPDPTVSPEPLVSTNPPCVPWPPVFLGPPVSPDPLVSSAYLNHHQQTSIISIKRQSIIFGKCQSSSANYKYLQQSLIVLSKLLSSSADHKHLQQNTSLSSKPQSSSAKPKYTEQNMQHPQKPWSILSSPKYISLRTWNVNQNELELEKSINLNNESPWVVFWLELAIDIWLEYLISLKFIKSSLNGVMNYISLISKFNLFLKYHKIPMLSSTVTFGTWMQPCQTGSTLIQEMLKTSLYL